MMHKHKDIMVDLRSFAFSIAPVIGLVGAEMSAAQSAQDTLPKALPSIDARVGEVFQIKLPSRPSTGYGWQIDESDGAEVSLVQKDVPSLNGQKPKVGGPAQEVITLKAEKIGKTTLTLSYRRPWEKRSSTDQTVTAEAEIRGE
jgi:inhibitor of cysteine peptidase